MIKHIKYQHKVLRRASHALTKTATKAEKLLKGWIRQSGHKFEFQYPIPGIEKFGFVADFVCLENKTIVEVDEPYHATPSQKAKDLKRSNELNALGYKVLRVTDYMVIQDPYFVATAIGDAIRCIKHMNSDPFYDGACKLYCHPVQLPGPMCLPADRPVRVITKGRAVVRSRHGERKCINNTMRNYN